MLSSESNDAADEKLVEAIGKNEQDAFKILYYRYFQKPIRFEFYRLHSVVTVRNLIQELFFRVWAGREILNSQKSINISVKAVEKLMTKVFDALRKTFHKEN